MNDESHSPAQATRPAEQASPGGLAALSRVTFDDSDVGEIFREATAAVDGLASCQVEAGYRSVNGGFVRFPPSQPDSRCRWMSGCAGTDGGKRTNPPFTDR